MKKILLLLMFFVTLNLKAQNLQLHYDLNHKFVYSHIESFKSDKYGSSYFFVDMNYNENSTHGVSMAYWEVSRALKFWKNPFALHFEYDGGFEQYQQSAYQINDALLFGGEYTWNNVDFSKVFNLQVMYKTIRDKNTSFQITGVWSIDFLKKLTFSGFLDFWRENNVYSTANTKYTLLTKPQLWYNFTKQFSIGTEQGFSSNLTQRGINWSPEISTKWIF